MPSPQLETIVNVLRSRRTQFTNVEEARASMEQMAAFLPIPGDVRVKSVDAGGVPAEWVRVPGGTEDRTVLFFHGGGYLIGSLNTHREMVSRIARAAGGRALSVAYRLGPENPFPAAVEDATKAYRWLVKQTKPSRVVISGDSAGGGLTMATLVALRDAGDPLPAAGVCLSPWVDLEGSGESAKTKAALDPIFQPDDLNLMALGYLGGANPRAPLASPLYADLKGLPPLLVHVGTAEVLLDDSVRLAERARAAGVEVTLEIWDEMIHVWQIFAAMLPEGQQAIERIGEYIRQRVP